MIEIIRGSLLEQDVDVIVNAANTAMRGGRGINGMVHNLGGPGLTSELAAAAPNGADVGTPVLTKGHNLKQPYVIHVAGPVWRDGCNWEPKMLAACYRNSMDLAQEKGVGSIGFCSISTGIFGYPLELAAPIAVGEVTRWLAEHPNTSIKKVIFAMFLPEEYAVFVEVSNRTKGKQC